MIGKPTVLVLGAGASMDFQFPSGARLRRILCDANMVPTEVRGLFAQCGFSHDDYSGFSSALRFSSALSVDVFLENRPDLREIGKLAMAAALIPFERAGSVHPLDERPTWLQLLFERMHATSAAEWHKNQLTIVTFNYDRVLEHFLNVSLRNTFKLDEAAAEDLRLKTVPIVHVHGDLGNYAVGGGPGCRPFSSMLGLEQLQLAAKRIRIVHEGSVDDPAFVAARTAIQRSVQVVLMGFGYGEANMSRLRLGFAPGAVFGSAHGMTERERALAKTRASPKLVLDENGHKLDDFLRNYPVMDP